MNTPRFDIVIVGGGMNGASLALALAGSGLRLALLESRPLDASDRPSYDDRAIALALGSVRILDRLGVWPQLQPQAEPIRQIHISDRGHFGFCRIDRAEEGVDYLGQVALARDIGLALDQGLRQANLTLICPATLLDFEQLDARVRLRLSSPEGQRTIDAALLVAADGAESPVRKALGLPVRQWDYGQHALVANITPGRPHQGVAYERFTDTGPLALLPMPGERCAMVWTARDDQVDGLLALDAARFLVRLQQRFGYRLGPFRQLGRRAAYPLRMMQVREHFRGRVLLIGNAAHTVHPIAGQGFNLGLRDVAVLAELLRAAARNGQDPGDEALLRAYVARRDGDQQGVTLATDLLARLFASPLPPLRWARDLGLLGIDLLPGAKHWIARRAMGLGLHGRTPRVER